MTDFEIETMGGGVYRFQPVTDGARRWAVDHVPEIAEGAPFNVAAGAMVATLQALQQRGQFRLTWDGVPVNGNI